MKRPAIGYGVVGMGFMGRVHVEALQRAAADGFPVRLVAVADPDPERRSGRFRAAGNVAAATDESRLFDPAEVRGHASLEDLLADEEVEALSLCTRTETHVAFAIEALRAGKHVLVEKPVALTSAAVESLLAEAERHPGLRVMPAMCMRFWPGWTELAEALADGRFGRPRSAVFRRVGPPPTWSRDFYGDLEKSGGALFDLHVHDVDFLRAVFGDPVALDTAGTALHLTTLYRFADPALHVTAEGGWGASPGFPFTMRYTVAFERATLDFDLARETPLFLYAEGEARPQTLVAGNGYDGEIRHFLNCIAEGLEPRVGLADSLAVTRLLEREARALAGR